MERVTVTLPEALVREIGRMERNRSRFVLEAVQREIERRRREGLYVSLRNPHPESLKVADEGIADWAEGLPAEDIGDLVDPASGTGIRWIPGKGWEENPA